MVGRREGDRSSSWECRDTGMCVHVLVSMWDVSDEGSYNT